MKDLIINLLFKLVNVEMIAKIMAKCVAYLLEWARGSASEDGKWDKAKSIIEQVNNWSSLFLEVYADDRLTIEEEEKIANAIEECTDKEKVNEILNRIQKKAKSPRKAKAVKDKKVKTTEKPKRGRPPKNKK